MAKESVRAPGERRWNPQRFWAALRSGSRKAQQGPSGRDSALEPKGQLCASGRAPRATGGPACSAAVGATTAVEARLHLCILAARLSSKRLHV